ncbi:MAG: PorV/PorQ family protein [bacterium]|nr:PorV/PorQ family protein [bacterium]
MGMILLVVINFFSDAGGEFLTINPGARQAAMGYAFTGVADDITAVYYNPGGFAFCKNLEIGCMPPSEGLFAYALKYTYVGGITPLPFKIGSFGLGYSCLFTSPTDGIIDDTGNKIGWRTYDYTLIFSYGKEIIKNIGLGLSLKYFYDTPYCFIYDTTHSKTFVFDFGGLYKTPIPGLSWGISCQNLGDSMHYANSRHTWSKQMPFLVRTGFGFNNVPFKKNLPSFIPSINLSGDITRDLVGTEHENWYSGGIELAFNKVFTLRGGYFNDNTRGYRSGITYGCGFNIGFLQIDISNDGDVYEFLYENWRMQVNVKPLYFYNRKK